MSNIAYRSPQPPSTFANTLFNRAVWLLSTTVWISTLAFGLYILLIYGVTWAGGNFETWNDGPLHLYAPDSAAATNGIGLHFLGGGILLVLGNVQLLPSVRNRFPQVHRWLGRLYASMAVLTAIGGFVHIVTDGTVGGTIMDIGFALYGILMLIAAVETARHARAKRFDVHRAWSLRLYALAVGSWLYRIEYGIWFVFTGGLGIDDFNGPFDRVMVFFFYIPNLLLVEWLLRTQKRQLSGGVQIATSIGFAVISLFVVYVAYLMWLPDIIAASGLLN